MNSPVLYSKYAKYYDLLYPIEKYEEASRIIKRIFQLRDFAARTILDVACGTGTLAKLMYESGYDVVGVDAHRAMIAIARKKLPQGRFYVSRMQSLPQSTQADAVICMSALNYVSSKAQLKATFRQFYRLLPPGGLLIVLNVLLTDVPRKLNSIHFNGSSADGLSILKVGTWQKTTRSAGGFIGKFVMLVRHKSGVEFAIDLHRLYAFNTGEIKSAMQSAGFETTVYDGDGLSKFGVVAGGPIFVGEKPVHPH